MKKKSNKQIEFTLNKINLTKFLEMAKDLAKIDESGRLLITRDEFLFYSLHGDTTILAFKSYQIRPEEIFGPTEETFGMIFIKLKKLAQILSFYEEAILTFEVRESGLASSLKIKSDKLTQTILGGEPFEVKEINPNQIKAKLNPESRHVQFIVSGEDLDMARKLGTLDSDGEVVSFVIESGIVRLEEGNMWSLNVAETDHTGAYMFRKKYLSSIETGDNTISIYDSFISIEKGDTLLLITLDLADL